MDTVFAAPTRDPEETVERCQGQLNDGYGGYRDTVLMKDRAEMKAQSITQTLPSTIPFYSNSKSSQTNSCKIPRGQSSLLLSPRSPKEGKRGTSTQRAQLCLTQW